MTTNSSDFASPMPNGRSSVMHGTLVTRLLCSAGSPYFFVLDRVSDSLAVLIIILFAVIKKRRNSHGCCGGRPAIQPPVDFLRSASNRFSYAIAYGTVSVSVVDLFFTKLVDTEHYQLISLPGPSWIRVFFGILAVLEQVTISMPFFLCLSTDVKLLGNIVGIIYTAFRSFVLVQDMVACPIMKKSVFPLWPTFFNLPIVFFHAFLLGRFIMLLVRMIRQHYGLDKKVHSRQEENEIAAEYAFIHVKNLLNPRSVVDNSTKPWYSRLRDKVYRTRPDFKFSVQVIATVVVSAVIVYELVIFSVPKIIEILTLWRKHSLWKNDVVVSYSPGTIEFIESLIDVVKGSVAFVGILSALFIYYQMYRMLISHRNHVIRMIKADKIFLPKEVPDTEALVGHGLKYCGFQIAYFLWGYIILMGALLIVVASVEALILALVNLRWFRRKVAGWILGVLPAVAMFVFGVVVQMILARVVFRKRSLKDSKGIVINNRQLYLALSFFFFFFNILIGLVACIIRLTIGILFAILYLGRVDRSVMMKGFHVLDRGYMAYLGFLHVQVAHKHPVLLVFCQILNDSINDKKSGRTGKVDSAKRSPLESHRGLNRWLVAFTMIKNPSLIRNRKKFYRHVVLNMENPCYEDEGGKLGQKEPFENDKKAILETTTL